MAIFPDKTAAATFGLNKRASRTWLNILLVILLAATILSLPGGADGIHIMGGILLMIGCSIHLALHGRWIKTVILETPKNVTPALYCQQRLFWGMFFSGSLCGLSGLISLLSVLGPHVFLPLHCCGTPIHLLSGLTFLGLNTYHLVLHRNYFKKKLATYSSASKRNK